MFFSKLAFAVFILSTLSQGRRQGTSLHDRSATQQEVYHSGRKESTQNTERHYRISPKCKSKQLNILPVQLLCKTHYFNFIFKLF